MDASSAIARQLNADQYARFRIYSQAEILSLMQALQEQRNAVTLYFGASGFIVSRVLAVDGSNGALYLDLGANAQANERLLAADSLVAATSLSQVTLEFALEQPQQVQMNDGPALRAMLPDCVLRLQRRESFRVPASTLRPLLLYVPTQSLELGDLRLRVLDVSSGGLGVESMSDTLHLQNGMLLENCRLDLPETGQIIATVEVRHVETGADTSGKQRCGLRFVDLAPQMAALMQRYVMKLEREWRALR